MTRAKDISKILTDADISGTLDVSGAFTSQGIDDNADATAITIDSSERVGIGTNSPSQSLHVKGNIDVEGDTSGVSKIRFKAEEIHGEVEGINIGSNFGGLAFKTNSNGTVAERLRIDSQGNLLAGTTSVMSNFGEGRTTVAIKGTGTADYSTLQLGNNATTGDTQILGVLAFHDNTARNAQINAQRDGGTNDGSLNFFTASAGNLGSAKMTIDNAGHVTKPYQSAFLAKPASQQSNLATGSAVDIVLGTEIFDNNADFASNTFTAPVTGRYQLNAMLRLGAVDTASEYYLARISTSNRNHDEILDSNEYSSDLDYYAFSLSVLTDMDSGDTAKLQVFQNSGTAQTDVDATDTRFSGYLVC
ncbi:endosialidase [uncultured Mediterranean phage uvMED]|nr:endosialidase [uncultured Mediterranean phage uvMED]